MSFETLSTFIFRIEFVHNLQRDSLKTGSDFSYLIKPLQGVRLIETKL